MLSSALFKAANYWQDEAAVFVLVGATFMTAANLLKLASDVGA